MPSKKEAKRELIKVDVHVEKGREENRLVHYVTENVLEKANEPFVEAKVEDDYDEAVFNRFHVFVLKEVTVPSGYQEAAILLVSHVLRHVLEGV